MTIGGTDDAARPVAVTIQAQIKCVERELGMREVVYARRISAGKMTLTESNEQMALMRAVLKTLHDVERGERLI
jgi:hypothetical protein